MSRKGNTPQRSVLPDPKHGSETIARFINMVMLSGKKSVAEKIVYSAMDVIGEKNPNSIELVQKALDNVLGMLGDDGTETAGAPTGAATVGQPTGGRAQIPGVTKERQAELRVIAERAMAAAKGDKVKAEEIFNAEVAKRYPDLVPAAQP